MTSTGSDRALFQDSASYDDFMGRYSKRLADEFASGAGVAPAERVLDVGCGPGALTTVLAGIVGEHNVAAVDPSEPFVEHCRELLPGADVRVGPAEALPFENRQFDRTLCQLVLHFVDDPGRSAREMARVTREGGLVAGCVWDLTGGMTMLRAYWDAVREAGVEGRDEGERFGTRPGQIADVWRSAGLRDIVEGSLTTSAAYRDFDELWGSFLGGTGPAGAHARSLGPKQDVVRDALRRIVGSPNGPFTLDARAWYAAGTV